jgi:hypothetical protein
MGSEEVLWRQMELNLELEIESSRHEKRHWHQILWRAVLDWINWKHFISTINGNILEFFCSAIVNFASFLAVEKIYAYLKSFTHFLTKQWSGEIVDQSDGCRQIDKVHFPVAHWDRLLKIKTGILMSFSLRQIIIKKKLLLTLKENFDVNLHIPVF